MRGHAAAFVLAAGCAGAAGQTFFGPSPYLSEADSPFAGTADLIMEDFEDGEFDAPGVSASAGAPFGPGSITDSVDADDGAIDGSGTGGWSFFFGSGPTGIRFTFDAGVLGSLPQRAGIVWTDGSNSIRFEAFDASGTSLGVVTGSHADGGISGTTKEDRFYGVEFTGGIGAIHIACGIGGGGGIEVDHLQYTGQAGCNAADIAPPLGTLDFFDVLEFLSLFDAMDPAADFAPPFGTVDFFDVLEFLDLFAMGCP